MLQLDKLKIDHQQWPEVATISVSVSPPKRLNHFLKGPSPLSWLTQAGRLPGRALHVGMAIWYRCGLEKSLTVSVSSKVLSEFGVDRFAKRRALDALAEAKLISVVHHHGRNPIATIIMPQGHTE